MIRYAMNNFFQTCEGFISMVSTPGNICNLPSIFDVVFTPGDIRNLPSTVSVVSTLGDIHNLPSTVSVISTLGEFIISPLLFLWSPPRVIGARTLFSTITVVFSSDDTRTLPSTIHVVSTPGDINNLINTIPVICTPGIIRILPNTIRAVSTPGDTYQLSFFSLRPYPPHYRTNFVVFNPGSILTLLTTVLILWSSPRVVSVLSALLY